jgi:hypothetical protein
MVQLRLPANSRIRTGKNWPKSDRATRTKTFKVYRLNPDDLEIDEGRFEHSDGVAPHVEEAGASREAG